MDRSTKATLSTYNTQIHFKSSAKDLPFPKFEIAISHTAPLTGDMRKSNATGQPGPNVHRVIPEAKSNIA